MSAAAPPPPRRASRTPRAGCWRTPPRHAWFSRSKNRSGRLGKALACPPSSIGISIGRRGAKARLCSPYNSGITVMTVVRDDIEPLTVVFQDDGLVPNNPLPFLVYKGAVDVDNEHPGKTIEGLFGAN